MRGLKMFSFVLSVQPHLPTRICCWGTTRQSESRELAALWEHFRDAARGAVGHCEIGLFRRSGRLPIIGGWKQMLMSPPHNKNCVISTNALSRCETIAHNPCRNSHIQVLITCWRIHLKFRTRLARARRTQQMADRSRISPSANPYV